MKDVAKSTHGHRETAALSTPSAKSVTHLKLTAPDTMSVRFAQSQVGSNHSSTTVSSSARDMLIVSNLCDHENVKECYLVSRHQQCKLHSHTIWPRGVIKRIIFTKSVTLAGEVNFKRTHRMLRNIEFM